MSTTTNTTTSHEVIQLWCQDRGGVPASVRQTNEGDDAGILRVHFPGQGNGDQLDEISWGDFFNKFEESQLAFRYEVRTESGELSRFSRFVDRNS